MEYVNIYGETYEDFVRDALDNNEIPWSKDRWISWKEKIMNRSKLTACS